MFENTKVNGLPINFVMKLMLKLVYHQTMKGLDTGSIVQITEEFIDVFDGTVPK